MYEPSKIVSICFFNCPLINAFPKNSDSNLLEHCKDRALNKIANTVLGSRNKSVGDKMAFLSAFTYLLMLSFLLVWSLSSFLMQLSLVLQLLCVLV